jgi:hypothetical protein
VVAEHEMPMPKQRQRTPWYVLILPLIPLTALVFALAGWWNHYKWVVSSVGLLVAAVSLWLQYRRNRLDQSAREHS